MARQRILVNPAVRELEAYLDFSGGRNSEISNEELKDNEFPVLDNVDLWSRGSCKRRTGRRSIAAIAGITNGTAEVDMLTISAAPTVSGNVTVTLNGVATNIAVTIGVAEVDTLTVTSSAASAGNVAITLNGVVVNVAVASGDTASAIATKIAAATYTGWTASASAATVTFTKAAIGTCSPPSFSGGSTGVSGTFAVTTAGVNADTIASVVSKIAATTFTGWTTSISGNSVNFTKTTVGVVSAPAYNVGSTGANGTMMIMTTGVNKSVVQGIFPFFRPNMTSPDLIVAAGGKLYVIPTGTTTATQINITDGGSAWTFQTSLTVEAAMYKGIMYVATGTKLTQITWDSSNGWKSQTVTPYAPTVMEAIYIGTNALAANPDNWIADGTGTVLGVAGIKPATRTGMVNTKTTMTAYINKPAGVTAVDYKWEYQKSVDGTTWTLGRDWTKEDGSNNAKSWDFTPDTAITYNIRVTIRDDANQATTYTYTMSAFVVNATQDAMVNNPPPVSGIQHCRKVLAYYDRLILSGDDTNPYQIYITDLTNPMYVPTTNTISFDTGKLEPITAIVQFRDMLIVFTASTIQTLTGHTTSTFARAVIQDGMGCVAPRSAIVTGNTVTFLSSQGIMQLKPNPFLIEVLNVNRVDMQIRTEVLNAISPDANAFLYNSQYWICFPSTQQMFRLYMEAGMVWTRDFSPKICMTDVVLYGSNIWELGSDGKIYLQDTTRYDDDGYNFLMTATGKFYDLGSSFNWKKLKRIYFIARHFGKDVNIAVTVQADSTLALSPENGSVSIVNDQSIWNITTTPNFKFYAGTSIGSWVLGTQPLGNQEVSVLKSTIHGKARRVQVSFTHSDATPCEVFGFGIEFREKQPQQG